MRVPLTRPWTDEHEIEAVKAVIQSGWLTQGQAVADFENAVATYVGAKHAIACTSCTTALHVALLLKGIGPGDEVVVPSYTWIATANVVLMTGAKPVFADIDPRTFNVTAETVEAALTPATKALMPVHQFGLPADLDSLSGLATSRGLALIEDAACALGSRCSGKPIGGHGNVTCLSFHPRKLITTGEGGMILTDDDALARQARVLINHGASVSDSAKHAAGTVEALLDEEFRELGFNYRMTNLQGAVGTAQMGKLEEILAARRAKAQRYTDAFSGVRYVMPPVTPDHASPNWQSYAIRITDDCPVKRNTVAQRLLDAGIACRPAYMACHLHPVYQAIYPGLGLPQTESVLSTLIILPLYPQMTDDEQSYVIEQLKEAVSG